MKNLLFNFFPWCSEADEICEKLCVAPPDCVVEALTLGRGKKVASDLCYCAREVTSQTAAMTCTDSLNVW